MLPGYLRAFLRPFSRQPALSLAAGGMLALGIGANVAVFSFVNALLVRPLPFPEPDRLVRLESVRGNQTGKLMSREWYEFDRDHTLFDGVAAWYPSQYNLAENGPPEMIRACMTTGNIFRVLGVRVVEGASWPEDFWRSRNAVIVLTQELWERRYHADRGVVGRAVTLDNSPYQVSRVVQKGFHFPLHSDLFRAANFTNAQNKDLRSLFTVGRLRPGITLEQAQARIATLSEKLEQLYPDTNRGIRFRVTSLRDAYVGEVRPYLILTLALAAVVLAIACVNVVNLLLARGLARRKELAVRAALGADSGRLIRDVLGESLTLTLPGALAGLLCAYWWVALLRRLLIVDLPDWMHVEIDTPVLIFATLISLAAGLAAGVIPALAASRPDLEAAFRDASRGSSTGRSHARLRNLLVMGELTLAVTLLAAAGLLIQSFWRLQSIDTGFRREGALTLRVDPPWGRYNTVQQTVPFYKRALERLQAIPGVQGVAANHSLPLALNQNYGKPSIMAEGQDLTEQQHNFFVNPQVVSPNYLSVMRIPLAAGRTFTDNDRPSTLPVVVLSHPVARRLFAGRESIGRRVRFDGLLSATEVRAESWFTVVGIAEPVRSESLLSVPGMDVYFSNQQQFVGDTFFVLRTAQDPSLIVRMAERAIQEIDPELPIFDVKTYPALVDDTIWQQRIAGRLSIGFGVLALGLAALGAYSVLSYSVSQRARELGIRQTLGSTRPAVRMLVVRDGMRIALPGIGAGLLTAALLGLGLRSLVYGGPVVDWISFAAVAAIAAAVSLLACYVPAWRASRVDPAVVLRDG